jgi:hypothetical protein
MNTENKLPSIFDIVLEEKKTKIFESQTHHYSELEDQIHSEDEELREIVIDQCDEEDVEPLTRGQCIPLSLMNSITEPITEKIIHSIEDFDTAVADLEEVIGVTRQQSIKTEQKSNISIFCSKCTNLCTNLCTNSCSIQ